jgi:hypothetical protein
MSRRSRTLEVCYRQHLRTPRTPADQIEPGEQLLLPPGELGEVPVEQVVGARTGEPVVLSSRREARMLFWGADDARQSAAARPRAEPA